VNLPISQPTVEIVISYMNRQTMNFVNMVVGFKNPNIVSIAPIYMNANTDTKSAIATTAIPSSGVKTVIIVAKVPISRTAHRVTNVSDV